MAICAWLSGANLGLAGTTLERVQYYPELNLLSIWGGRGDDRIEVALAKDSSVLLNGVPLSKLGIPLKAIPVVAVHGGEGNDILISRGIPVAALNGGDGKDIVVWDDGEGGFDRAVRGDDVVLCSSQETQFAFGGGGLDILIANTGGDRDAVLGGLGRDVLIGGRGADTQSDEVFGDLGNDWIVGGTGQD